MKILVDTHVFLYAITGDSRFSKKKHRTLWLGEDSELCLSFASVTWLGVRASHFAELESLPPLHRDPFDRMLVAQARAEKIPIATVDPFLRRYGVKVL